MVNGIATHSIGYLRGNTTIAHPELALAGITLNPATGLSVTFGATLPGTYSGSLHELCVIELSPRKTYCYGYR
jgi:hypothetical protein